MIRWLEKKSFAAWVIVFLLAGIIFYVSSLSFEDYSSQKKSGVNAVIYHISIFFIFSFFLMLALVRGRDKRFFIVGILGAIGYGIIDEIHQYFVPGRASSLGDVFLDSVGVIFAFMIYFILIESRKATRGN